MADPGSLFDYNQPRVDSPATSKMMRDQFSALAQNFYTTDPNIPFGPKRGQFRVLDDPAVVPQDIKLQWYGGVAWITLLRNLQNIPELQAGAGLSLLSSGGLKFVLEQLAVEPADIAGAGLEDDGFDRLRVTAGADTTAVHTDVSGEIDAVTPKATPVVGDKLLIEDSADTWAKKSIDLTLLLGGGLESFEMSGNTPTLSEAQTNCPDIGDVAHGYSADGSIGWLIGRIDDDGVDLSDFWLFRGGAETSPSVGTPPNGVSGLITWLDFSDDDNTTQTSGNFEQASDKSGNGNNYVQLTASVQPLVSAIGDLQAAKFDGVDDLLRNTIAALSNSAGTVIIAFRIRAATGGDQTITAWEALEFFFDDAEPTKYNLRTGLSTFQTDGAPLVVGTTIVVAFTGDGANYLCFTNGASEAITRIIGGSANDGDWHADASGGTDDDLNFGVAVGGGSPLDGFIGEYCEYNRVLTPTEILDVSTYLVDKWITTPLAVAGLQIWVDFSDTSTITFGSGTAIAAVRDKQSAISFLQADSALQPDRSETINGVLAATFDSAGDWLRVSGLSLAHTAGTVIAVVEVPVQPYPLSTLASIFAAADNTDQLTLRFSDIGTTNSLDFVSTIGASFRQQSQDTGIPDGRIVIVSFTTDGSTSMVLYVDGIVVPSTQSGAATATWMSGLLAGSASDLYIGQTGVFGIDGGNAPYQGKIGEILVYDRVLSAGEITTVHTNYLNPKWLNWTLPVTAGIIKHIDFSDTATTTKSGGKFTDITDKSGNSFDYTQATDANRPDVSSIGSLEAALFNAGDEMTNVTKVLSNTSGTVFVVMQNASTTAQFFSGIVRAYDGNTGIEDPFLCSVGIVVSSSTCRWSALTTGDDVVAIYESSTPTIPTGTPSVVRWDVSANNTWTGAVNGTAVTHQTYAGAGVNAMFWYGGLDAGAANDHRIGSATVSESYRVGEIVEYDRVLSAAEQAYVRGYLTKKWGI